MLLLVSIVLFLACSIASILLRADGAARQVIPGVLGAIAAIGLLIGFSTYRTSGEWEVAGALISPVLGWGMGALVRRKG
jgi:hypothetical protein